VSRSVEARQTGNGSHTTFSSCRLVIRFQFPIIDGASKPPGRAAATVVANSITTRQSNPAVEKSFFVTHVAGIFLPSNPSLPEVNGYIGGG